MPSYDYTIAKEVLNEADKDRIVCLYLSSDPSAIDWAKATKDFGSASVESFKKTTQNMLKKIEKAGGKIEDGEATGTGTTSPVKPAAKAAPKKRKAKGDAEDGEEKPKKKGRAAKGKKADSPDEDEEKTEEAVKEEAADEEA